MELHSYLLFIGAAAILCIVPGPDMAYMLARTITQGRRAGLMAAFGINAGAYVHVLAAVFGLSAILAASSMAFTILKWMGACYLIWIGVRMLLSRAKSVAVEGGQKTLASHRRIFWEGFLSDALNPKVAIFFLAFLPQFVSRESELGTTTQLLILGVTCNVVAILINVVLVFCASAATRALRTRGGWIAWLNRASGALFIGLGVRLARS
jgi:threonine/homoserine/homoserine lactone efflux protein